MERRIRNRILIFLVAAGIVAFFLVWVSGRQQVAKIMAVKPVVENLVASVSSNGKVEPISPYVMRAQLDTFVQKIHAQEGQSVKKGQLLLELDVKDAAAQLAQAQSRLLQAQDDLRAAQGGGRSDAAARASGDLAKAIAERDRVKRSHDALQRLVAQQAATKDELAANEVELTKAQSEVDRLTAVKSEFDRAVKLDAGKYNLQVQQVQNEVAAWLEKVGDGKITAPADGTLYSLPVRQGDFVKVGDLLAEMADLHKVRVRAFVDEPELGGLEPNEPVRITWDALPNRTWEGKTEVIPKQVVPRGSRSVGELLCSVNNEKLELLPNVNVDVRISARERNNVLTVPRSAVESEAGKRFVFVVKDGGLNVGKNMLEKRPIVVGIADAANYEVIAGLSAGEMVALPGDFDLRDGMLVKVVNSDASGFLGGPSAN
ncbi:MAG: efflux RND transporter periplasmic adaptor subunit [Acidobacteria bacterium]|nr:efflux RND transporter periplasmic adaptor subunit [Acidobacteriota bacterium]MBS1865306.1 efflux RND transporter periplasmic adaptor subunit [Acidobacteriota bacterium]